MRQQSIGTNFLRDAIPLIYKAKRDGSIIFLEGGFEHILTGLGFKPDSFTMIQDVLTRLGIEVTVIEDFFTRLADKKEMSAKVKLKINGVNKAFLWISTLSRDGKNIQGQLINIDRFEKIEKKYDRLRQMTYGTSYLGNNVALGKESARTRDLTIMFIDAVESTSKMSKMKLREARKYIEDLSHIITSVADEYSGYIDKFMGDGAMIVWGYQLYPEAVAANHASQAVLAGKEILNRCEQYNHRNSTDKQIHIRIGIDSGEVISGVFDNPHRIIFSSIGPPVNIAARLEKLADVDSMLISHRHLDRLQAESPEIISSLKCSLFQLKGVPDIVKACKVE